MDYKVLMPVTNNPELVSQKFKDIPDMSKLILVNNFDNPEVYQLSLQAKDQGAEVYYFPQNLGLAPSWNLGMQRMKEDNCDFVIFLSPSVVFDKSMQLFIDYIVNSEAEQKKCRYVCSGLATMHCFAHTRLCLEVGGEFDENFWPIYYEDTDYSKRSQHNGIKGLVKLCGLNDVAHSLEYCISMKNKQLFQTFQNHAHRQGTYYVSKWGGTHTNETFTRPFNDPKMGINDWVLAPGVPVPPKPYRPI